MSNIIHKDEVLMNSLRHSISKGYTMKQLTDLYGISYHMLHKLLDPELIKTIKKNKNVYTLIDDINNYTPWDREIKLSILTELASFGFNILEMSKVLGVAHNTLENLLTEDVRLLMKQSKAAEKLKLLKKMKKISSGKIDKGDKTETVSDKIQFNALKWELATLYDTVEKKSVEIDNLNPDTPITVFNIIKNETKTTQEE